MSNIKYVTDSKVNSLNEFKKQRTQLTQKFLEQEDELSKIKAEKDNLVYETEKKLIIAKEQWVKKTEFNLCRGQMNKNKNKNKKNAYGFEFLVKELFWTKYVKSCTAWNVKTKLNFCNCPRRFKATCKNWCLRRFKELYKKMPLSKPK